MVARTVEELDGDDIERLLDASLEPRGPDLLFALAEELGLGAGWTVLDVGCRDGAQLVELHRRTGCARVGLEPAADNLARAPADATAPAPIRLVRGVRTSRQLLWAARLLRDPAPHQLSHPRPTTPPPPQIASRAPSSPLTVTPSL